MQKNNRQDVCFIQKNNRQDVCFMQKNNRQDVCSTNAQSMSIFLLPHYGIQRFYSFQSAKKF